jgi:hypothetical protein
MNVATSFRLGSALMAVLGFLSTAGLAQGTEYIATGQILSGQAPALVFTNAAGQVLFRANMHTARVTSTEARITGRRRILVDGYYHADGTATIWGTCQQEVGTWTDTTFIPNGGVWDIRYSGTMGVDNSLQLQLAGEGQGGNIDGMLLKETLTRAAAPDPNDIFTPYEYSGTIEPAPVVTRTVVDNFDAPPLSPWHGEGPGEGSLSEVNGTLHVHGYWPGTVTSQASQTYYWAFLPRNWSIANDRTLEWRVDLRSLTTGSTNAASLVVGSSSTTRMYLFYKGTTYLQLSKWIDGLVVLSHENLATPNENVVLSLALTRSQGNLIVTARVLDQANPEVVLYQRTVIDTPKADPSLTYQQLRALGMNLSVMPDRQEPPLFAGDRVLLNSWQYTDGMEPAVDVVYDNLEERSYPTPLLGIERSVTLLSPAGFDIQKATDLDGPWSPATEPVMTGIRRLSLPSNGQAEYFRAVPMP